MKEKHWFTLELNLHISDFVASAFVKTSMYLFKKFFVNRIKKNIYHFMVSADKTCSELHPMRRKYQSE